MKEGWKYKLVPDCLQKIQKPKQVKAKDYLQDGIYPIVSQEAEQISGYSNDESLLYKVDKPIIIFGDHTRVVKYIDFDFIVGADGTQLLCPKQDIDSRYFYYAIKSVKLRELGYARHFKLLKEQSIKIPATISEQEIIVEKLDTQFAKLDQLKANAEKQYLEAKELYQKALEEYLSPQEGWKEQELGSVGTFFRGGNFAKSDFIENGYPCIHYGQIHTTFGVSTKKHLTNIPASLAKKIAKPGNLIIAITSEDVEGSCKCTAWEGDYNIAVGGHIAVFDHKENSKLMSYIFKTKYFYKQKEQYAHGFKVMEIKPSDIAKIIVYLPPKNIQQQIVNKLDQISDKVHQLEENFKTIATYCDDMKQQILKETFE